MKGKLINKEPSSPGLYSPDELKFAQHIRQLPTELLTTRHLWPAIERKIGTYPQRRDR